MINYEILSQPAWDFFEGAQSDLHWERHLKDLSETSQRRYLFCDVFKTSQIHLKNDIFFVTSLTRLKCISKKMFFSVRCLEHSQKRYLFWDFSDASQKYLLKVFATVQIYPTKMVLCDIHRIFEISDKVDVGRLKTRKKWTIQEQCIAINQVSEAVSRRCSVKQDFLNV